MPLIKKIEQVLEHLPVSASSSDPDIPSMQGIAEQEYLLPVIGAELLEGLQEEADGLFPTDEEAEIPVPSDLYKKAMAALVPLAYYKEMPFLHTRITSTGLKNITTDSQQGAYRYQYENILEQCENIGLMQLEALYQFLMANKSEYADWENSEVYKRLNKNLIKTGEDFKSYFHIAQPHRTFFALQPIMQEVEDLYIKNGIGEVFFKELIDSTDPSDDETVIIELLRKSIANFTIHKACVKLAVKISPDGVTIPLSPGTDRVNNGQSNADSQAMLLQEATARDGNKYLNIAIRYLQNNASNTVFKTFFESDLYVDPAAPKTNINDSMNGIYAL
jgi:hypothetical protein